MINYPFSVNYYPVVRDPGDDRDFPYEKRDEELLEHVDLREFAGKIRNQVSLRSCSSEALVGAYEIILKKNYPDHYVNLSPLFVYYNARMLEGRRSYIDAGVYIRDAIRALKQYGVCAELTWPYNIENFSFQPTEESYKDAKKRTIKNYFKCRDFDDILDSLSSNVPVITSIKTYSNFSKLGWDGSAYLDIPDVRDFHIGGHAVCLVGYDKTHEKLIVRNSFGPGWADRGYFYIPFKYAEANFMDSWVIEIDLLD